MLNLAPPTPPNAFAGRALPVNTAGTGAFAAAKKGRDGSAGDGER